jgi:type II secretion system protein J
MRTRVTYYNARGAFTLLELLLAIAIFGVILGAINSVFYGAVRLRNKTTQMIEQAVPMQKTLTLMKKDLRGIVVPGGPMGGSLQTTMVLSGNTMGQQGGTVFYTCTGILDDDTPYGDVQKVSYSLRRPDNTQAVGQDLVRIVSRNLLADTQELVNEQWLMGGVENLQLTYFDGNIWRDVWDSTTPDINTGLTNNLPKAVKVQLQMASAYGEERKTPVEMVIPVMVEGRTNAVQTATGGTQ